LNSMEETSDLQINHGKKIVEVRPPVGNNKGKIVEKIVENNNINQLIYLGDDTTDVDAFKEIVKLRKQDNVQAESIVVCSSETSSEIYESAGYAVKNVEGVEKFFNWLVLE
jgi:trehalose 6-phosphate phosphatase